MSGCYTFLWWTHSVSYNRYVSKCKGRRDESDSNSGIWKTGQIDDTLLELQDVLEASGFVCIAGMEAVAEHSLMHQFGTGRPDSLDEKGIDGICCKRSWKNITTQKNT